MKRILFSLTVVLCVSGAYSMNDPHSPCKGKSQKEIPLRQGFLLGEASPQVTRTQKMSTPEGRNALDKQIRRGEAVFNKLSLRFESGIFVSEISREDLADMYVYYNTFVPPELQIKDMIANCDPKNLIEVLVQRIVDDSEGDYVFALTRAALHRLPIERAAELMRALQDCQVLVRVK